MVVLYEKAIESFAKDILKFSPNNSSITNNDEENIGYCLKDIAKCTIYHATNKSSPINTCRKEFEKQLNSIGLDLKKIDTNNNQAYGTYLYWYPGENGLYSFYDEMVLNVYETMVVSTTYNGYSRIVTAFKNMDNSKLHSIFSTLLKDIDDCVEKGYKIKTPTLDKLVDTYMFSQLAKKYWDDICEHICTPYYGFIKQGMYLRDPKFTKDKLVQDLKNIVNNYNI